MSIILHTFVMLISCYIENCLHNKINKIDIFQNRCLCIHWKEFINELKSGFGLRSYHSCYKLYCHIFFLYCILGGRRLWLCAMASHWFEWTNQYFFYVPQQKNVMHSIIVFTLYLHSNYNILLLWHSYQYSVFCYFFPTDWMEFWQVPTLYTH